MALKGAGIYLSTQRVEDHRPPKWPDGDVELSVSDLEAAEAYAVGTGATKARTQPSPDRWRVLIDPVGPPFCITTLIPERSAVPVASRLHANLRTHH